MINIIEVKFLINNPVDLFIIPRLETKPFNQILFYIFRKDKIFKIVFFYRLFALIADPDKSPNRLKVSKASSKQFNALGSNFC